MAQKPYTITRFEQGQIPTLDVLLNDIYRQMESVQIQIATLTGSDGGTTIAHSALTGVTANQHHAQQHALSGADHTGALGAAQFSDATHGSRGAITNAHGWADIDKTVSSLADLATRSATDLTSGTLNIARFPVSGTWTLTNPLIFSGAPVGFPNNQYLGWDDSAGTLRSIFKVDGSDNLDIYAASATGIIGFNNFTDTVTNVSIADNGDVIINGLTASRLVATDGSKILVSVSPSSAYTPSNVTTDRTYDADATDVAELADVLGTLIADLQAVNILG